MTGAGKSFAQGQANVAAADDEDAHRANVLLIAGRCELFLQVDDTFDLGEEPGINFGELEDLFSGESRAERVTNKEDPFGVRDAEFSSDQVRGENVAITVDFCADAPGFPVAAK